MKNERDENGQRDYDKKMLSGDGGLAQQLVAVKVLLASKRPLMRDTQKQKDYSKPVEPGSLEALMMKEKKPTIEIEKKTGKVSVSYGGACAYGFTHGTLSGRLRQLILDGCVDRMRVGRQPFEYSLTNKGRMLAEKGDASIVKMCQAANKKNPTLSEDDVYGQI